MEQILCPSGNKLGQMRLLGEPKYLKILNFEHSLGLIFLSRPIGV